MSLYCASREARVTIMLWTNSTYIAVSFGRTPCNQCDACCVNRNCLGLAEKACKHMKYNEVFQELERRIENPSDPLQETIKRTMQLVWRTCAPDPSASKTLTAAIERFHESFALVCFFAGMDAPAHTMAEARKDAHEKLTALRKVCVSEALETVH